MRTTRIQASHPIRESTTEYSASRKSRLPDPESIDLKGSTAAPVQLAKLAAQIGASPYSARQQNMARRFIESPKETAHHRRCVQLTSAQDGRKDSATEENLALRHSTKSCAPAWQLEPATSSIISASREVTAPAIPLQRGVAQFATGKKGESLIKSALPQIGAATDTLAKEIYQYDCESHDGDYEKDTTNKIFSSAHGMGFDPISAGKLSRGERYEATEIPRYTTTADMEDQRWSADSFAHVTVPFGDQPLRFQNDFTASGEIKFCNNKRNPLLANFYASDVVQAQQDKLPRGFMSDVTKLTRSNVVSTSGGDWMRTLHFDKGERDLSATELHTFLHTTVNGKSSQRIASSMQKDIVAGKVTGDSDRWSVELMLRTRSVGSGGTSGVSSGNSGNANGNMGGAGMHATAAASSAATVATINPIIADAQQRHDRLLEGLEKKNSHWRDDDRNTQIVGNVSYFGRLLNTMRECEHQPDTFNLAQAAFDRQYRYLQLIVGDAK